MRIARWITLLFCCFLVFNSIGCEAFVRKFTRKPKKDKLQREEMVLVPQEYKKPQLTREEQYRQYFLYWKSWQDELIESLAGSTNHKKQIGCVREALSNLLELRSLLNTEKQKKLDVYIEKLKELQDSIVKDIYCKGSPGHRYSAERIKMNILRQFSYPQVKDSLA